MAFVNVRTPLKNLKTGDYFYPLTNLDQIITGNNRLSVFMSEDSSNHNLLNLSNIGNLSVNNINVNSLTVSGNTTLNHGNFYFNSDTGTYKFYITRGGSATESTGIWVNDSYTFFDVTNDETTANVQFKLQATDTESGGGAGAQTSYVNFYGRNGKSTINANCFGVNGDNTDYSLYVNGTSYFTNGVAIINDSSNTNYDSLFYVRNYSNNDWSIKIAKSTYNYGLYVEGTGTDLLRVGSNSTLRVGNGDVQINSSALKITNNSNTVTIGSLNSSYCHFQNSANIPFYFNKSIYEDGDLLPYTNNNRYLGNSSHYWNRCYATNFYGTLNGSATGVYTTSASGDNIAALKSVWNSLPANQTLGVYIAHGSASFFFGWRLSGYAVGNAYGGGIIDNYGNPDYVNISNGTFTAKHIWLRGDAVTSAVWNDYAENRCASVEVNFGQVLMEVGDDTLVPTTERLSHFAGIASDTWGFSQGETETAKTPIAVAGRVLAYPYRDRNEYKPGDCLCAAPNGTVDIMTREEIYKYPDRIVGTVSCVPIYEEWGGGKDADRKPVKVNGRIWVRVR